MDGCMIAAGEGLQPVPHKTNITGGIKEQRIYLGNFEIYRKFTSSSLTEEWTTLHITDDTGRIAMLERRTVGTTTSLTRYIYSNHLQSSSLELDEDGDIISYEEYHPFGTTSYQAMDATINASYKRYRYTGKERDDESGLYYHGARYYIPWLCRWSAVDPMESKYSGLTPYNYSYNNPIVWNDPSGEDPETYKVQKGDTLSKIAEKKGTTVEDLVKLNNISDPSKILAGANLIIRNDEGAKQNESQKENSSSKLSPSQSLLMSMTLQKMMHKVDSLSKLPLPPLHLNAFDEEERLFIYHGQHTASKSTAKGNNNSLNITLTEMKTLVDRNIPYSQNGNRTSISKEGLMVLDCSETVSIYLKKLGIMNINKSMSTASMTTERDFRKAIGSNNINFIEGSTSSMFTPERGDIFVWRKQNGVGHTGIVYKVTGESVTILEAIGKVGSADEGYNRKHGGATKTKVSRTGVYNRLGGALYGHAGFRGYFRPVLKK